MRLSVFLEGCEEAIGNQYPLAARIVFQLVSTESTCSGSFSRDLT